MVNTPDDAGLVRRDEVTASRSRLDRNPLYADIAIYAILVLLGLFTMLPMVNVLAKSLSESGAIAETR